MGKIKKYLRNIIILCLAAIGLLFVVNPIIRIAVADTAEYDIDAEEDIDDTAEPEETMSEEEEAGGGFEEIIPDEQELTELMDEPQDEPETEPEEDDFQPVAEEEETVQMQAASGTVDVIQEAAASIFTASDFRTAFEGLSDGSVVDIELKNDITITEVLIISANNVTVNIRGSFTIKVTSQYLFRLNAVNTNMNLDGVTISGGGIMLSARTDRADMTFSLKGENDALIEGAAAAIDAISTFNDNTGKTYITVEDMLFRRNTGVVFTVTHSYGSSQQNTSAKHGGAIAIYSGKMDVSRSTFAWNQAQFIGGAIYSGKAAVVIDDCLFENNVATVAGAIQNADGSLIVRNSEFIKNTATDNVASGSWPSYGGAICSNYGEVLVENSSFDNNKALQGGSGGAGYGGAIRLNEGTLEVISSTFTSNLGTWGGGIYAYDAAVTLTNCNMSGNEATTTSTGSYCAGGAAMVYSGSLTANDGNYKENCVTGKAATSGSQSAGGVFRTSSGASITINGGVYENNTSVVNGAAIEARGKTLTIKGEAKFINNSAANMGGAVYSIVNADIGDEVEFHNNSASQGGGLYITGTAAIGKVKFHNNTAQTGGGGAYLTGTAALKGTEFEENRSIMGGALYLTSNSYAISDGAQFINNEASMNGLMMATYGAGIYLGTNAGAKTGVIENTTFEENKAAQGGALYMRGSSAAAVSNVTFIDNHARDGHGGAINALSGAILDVQGSEFKKNSSSLYGGAVYFVIGTNTAGRQNLTGNTFIENRAAGDGGAVYLNIASNGVSNDFTGNTAKDNTAGRNGGGFYVIYNGRGTKVSDNVIEGNEAAGSGGGLYLQGNMQYFFTITNDKIVNNKAGAYGGGVYVTDSVFFMSEGTAGVGRNEEPEVTGNTAGMYGGGIYAAGYAKVVVQRGQISGNLAGGHGGGIYSSASLTDSLGTTLTEFKNILVYIQPQSGRDTIKLERNVAGYSGLTDEAGSPVSSSQYHGGAVYIAQSGELVLGDTEMSENRAYHGGAVYIANAGHLTVEYRKETSHHVKLTGNMANGNGGGLYLGSGVLDMYQTEISNNTANGDGGGAYIRISSTGEEDGADNSSAGTAAKGVAQAISGNLIDGNQAANGGGLYIYVTKDGLTNRIDSNTVKNNTAEMRGGGVYIQNDGEGRTIYDNEVTENKASYGGGIYVTGGGDGSNNRLSLSNDKISGNEALYGGGVYVASSSKFVLFDAETAGRKKLDEEGNETEEIIKGIPEITENKAKYSGGGVYAADHSEITVQSGRISRNQAGHQGGGIYLDVSAEWKTVKANSARVIYVTGNEAKDQDEGNNLTDELISETAGGGFYVRPGAEHILRLDGYEITGNYAQNGGGIYLPISSLEYLYVTNTKMQENTADTAETEISNEHEKLHNGDSGDDIEQRIKAVSPLSINPSQSGNQRFAYAYNNYDISYYTGNSIRFYFNANGGYFEDDGSDFKYTVLENNSSGIKESSIPKENELYLEQHKFIGWYDMDEVTAEDTLRIEAYDFEETKKLEPGTAMTVYAAWLSVPAFDLDDQGYAVYPSDREVSGTMIKGAVSVTVTWPDGSSSNADIDPANGVWRCEVPEELVLTPESILKAVQTIQPYGTVGTEDQVTSFEAKAVVGRGVSVLYSGNGYTSGLLHDPVEGLRIGSDYEIAEWEDPLQEIAKERNKFTGWYYQSAIYHGSDMLENIQDDVELIAYWKPLYTVTYVAPQGSSFLPIDIREYEEGEEVAVDFDSTTIPNRDGYIFTGWLVEGSDQFYPYEEGAEKLSVFTITEDVVLVAQYVKTSDLVIRKVEMGSMTNVNSLVRLQGAEFVLYCCTDSEHTHTAQDDVSGDCWKEWTDSAVISDSEGLVKFEALTELYTYILVETKAPDGYELPAGQWMITAVSGENSGDELTFEVQASDQTGVPAWKQAAGDEEEVLYWVPNQMSYKLPANGGNGVWPLILTGLGCIAVSIIIISCTRTERKLYNKK